MSGTIIDAMKDITEYELVICGTGPYKEQLEQQISKQKLGDKVHLLGYVSEERLKYEYETSAIFVLPSSAESFGIVLLEAMASGCAIITTNATGCPEVVGDTALLIRPKSPEDVRNALIKLINNDELRGELGFKARKRVEEEFTWEKIAKQYVAVYKDTISKGIK